MGSEEEEEEEYNREKMRKLWEEELEYRKKLNRKERTINSTNSENSAISYTKHSEDPTTYSKIPQNSPKNIKKNTNT